MAITTSEIQFLLSGGGNNSNPNRSLGGQPSSFPIVGNMNSLFPNITTEETSVGKTDYRCFYIFNKSDTNSLYDTEIYFDDQGFGGSDVKIGLYKSTDIQRVSIVGSVLGGGLAMLYGTTAFNAFWEGSPAGFELSLQNALRYSGAPGVTVSTEPQGNGYNFRVSFAQKSDNRSQPLLRIVSNNLSGPASPTASISKLSDGSPINSVAPLITLDTVPPSRVLFYTSDQSARIKVGDLNPGDGLPVWIKRSTEAGSEYQERDYFAFKVTGKPF